MKVKKEDIQKWANALRSGKYKQGLLCLQFNGNYCCLGVACDLFIPRKKLVLDSYKNIEGGFPGRNQPYAPKWLQNINVDFEEKVDISLSEINDSKEYSFNEIADLLELVYIHKALD